MHSHAPLAVLADIHGNSLALQAVLADAAARGITRFVNLGDTFYGPLDPAGTWAILGRMDMPAILGNQDRILLESDSSRGTAPAVQSVVERLGREGMNWLRTLPGSTILDGTILLTHGTPKSDTAYLLEEVTSGAPVMRACTEVETDILPEADSCSLILAGHSHVPGRLDCGGRCVVNPGSVGLPAYDDDSPPHVMAAGSPHARYAIVHPGNDGWEVEFAAVEYDWHRAAAMAADNGRNDWATWLKTGMA